MKPVKASTLRARRMPPAKTASGGAPAILTKTLESVPVGRLRPHPKNPRVGQVETILDSVTANGFYGAIVAQRTTGHVLVGNARLEAARRAGFAEVPVLWVDVDDDRALRILLTDNRTSDLAAYDPGLLDQLLADLEATTAGLAGTGYVLEDPLGLSEPTPVKVLPPPPMTWTLIGIPTVRFGEIAETVQGWAMVPETIVEISVGNAD